MTTPNDSPALVRPTRARFGVLLFICALAFITYLDRVCISRVRSDIEEDLGFSKVEMGLVFAAFVLGYALFEVPIGWMGDRWGARRVLTRIVITWSIFTALTGCIWQFSFHSGYQLTLGNWVLPLVFDSLVLMILVRFLFGLGEAGAFPNLARVVADWFPTSERASAQGAIWMTARLGGAFAPFIIGRMAVAIGWRQAFWVLGAVGIVWAIAFRIWFRSHPNTHPGCNEAERALIEEGKPKEAAHDGHSWPGVGLLAGSLTVWGMCLASFWVCVGWYFYPTWQPLYLNEVHGLPEKNPWAEVLAGLPFLCGAAGAFAGGRLSDLLTRRIGRRWGRSLTGLIGFSGAGVCVMATGFAPNAYVAVGLLCLAFLINDLAIPVMWATCADIGGRFAGSLSGLMNTVGAFGAILTPLLIPSVLDEMPKEWSAEERWRLVFLGLAGSWFIAAACWLVIDASSVLKRAS